MITCGAPTPDNHHPFPQNHLMMVCVTIALTLSIIILSKIKYSVTPRASRIPPLPYAYALIPL